MTTDTKTALLDAAEHAVRTRGFDGFSYADMAEAVGIRKASIHYHFPTKAVLSEALMDRYRAKVAAHCAEIEMQHTTGADRILHLIAMYRSALNDGDTLCLCVSLTNSHANLSHVTNDKIAAYRGFIIGWMTDVFALGQQDGSITGVTAPQQDAAAALAVLEGAHLAARATENVETFDAALAALISRCRRA